MQVSSDANLSTQRLRANSFPLVLRRSTRGSYKPLSLRNFTAFLATVLAFSQSTKKHWGQFLLN